MTGIGETTETRATASINLAAIERNVQRVRARMAPGVELCAVVKGDAYSHGAVPVAMAALVAGATCLAVSTAIEAVQCAKPASPSACW